MERYRSWKKTWMQNDFLDYKYGETKPKKPSFVSETLFNAVHIIEKHTYEK